MSNTNYRAGVVIDDGNSFTFEIDDTGFYIFTTNNINITNIQISELCIK